MALATFNLHVDKIVSRPSKTRIL